MKIAEVLAIKSAKKNLDFNRVAYERMWVGSINKTTKKYDVVVANIVTDILIALKKDLVTCLRGGGILILSGILQKYESKVITAYKNLSLIEKIQNKEWITLIYKKEEQ